MATQGESLYSAFLADLTEPERERVQLLAEQFGIDPTDAVWALMIVLERYRAMYSDVPRKIELTVQGLLEKIKDAAGDREAIQEAVEGTVRESITEVLVGQAEKLAALYDEIPGRIEGIVKGTLESVERAAKADALATRNQFIRPFMRVFFNGLLKSETRKEMLRGIGIGLGVVTAIVCALVGFSYWAGFDHGRVRGFEAGAEGRLVSGWASSAEGVGAYNLARTGELKHLVACDRPGWKIEDGVCVPRASEGVVYGWKLR